MSKLACLGGTPVTADLVGRHRLRSCKALERKYLLQAHESGVWDDWPDADSMATRFAAEWAAFCDSAFCALLTNGTHALQVALETLGIGAGDEVIVPGQTWQATASAVCDVNAVPVLVDIDPETWCVDPAAVEAAITPRTRAVMPVHLFHRMADMDRILPVARAHGLHVIEDCAHTHGSQWDGQGAGTLGDLGSFSFQRSKLVTAGEGGALLMQDETLYRKVLSQRSCGRDFGSGVAVHSGNYRMTSFQAAVLRAQLSAHKRNAPIIDRNGIALDKAVADAPGVRPLRRNPHITRQCSYGYGFNYDSDAFDGLPCEAFRNALGAEVGVAFGTTYTPLNHSEVYYPHTKRRHQLSKAYVDAITPARWHLPACEEVWKNRACIARWRIFACPPDRAQLLTDAIAKVHEHRHELLTNRPSGS